MVMPTRIQCNQRQLLLTSIVLCCVAGAPAGYAQEVILSVLGDAAAGGMGQDYGAAAASGLFNYDDQLDLAVGAPYHILHGGAVFVLCGPFVDGVPSGGTISLPQLPPDNGEFGRSVSVSEARSWRVEKDGSGDFAVIQGAVDASASGDTIWVGPGRFTEYTTHVYSGNNWYAYVHLAIGSITIIGSGDGITYIGPETPGTWNFGDYSVGVLYFPPQTSDRLRIVGVSITDVRYGQYIQSGSCAIEHCGFQRIFKGITSLGSCEVRNCNFQGGTNIDVLVASPATSVLIQQCEFAQSYLPFNCQLIPSVVVEDCVMTQCANAGMFDRCAGTMRRCNIAGTLAWGLGVYGTGAMQIVDNIIDGGVANIYFALGATNVDCQRNIFTGSTSEAVNISNCTPRFRGNHILKGTGKAVLLEGYSQFPDSYIDMTGNYWGTAIADSISAWIVDGNDATIPQMHGYVSFAPYSSVPVGTKSNSFGDLKALFR